MYMKFYKVGLLCAIPLLVANVFASAVQITDVKATPISPWAVKIDYRVVGGNGNDPLLFASNTITHQVYSASRNAIKGDFKLTEGRHSIRWHLMEDDVKWDWCNVTFGISEATYCVIDLSAGVNATSYPVIYLSDMPSGGWKAEHKTTKLVLRLIEPGAFKMNSSYDVTLTQPFYIGVFEVTQKQYKLVTGDSPSWYKGDTRPVEDVSWNTIRGHSDSYNWPNVKTVDPNSFVGLLRSKTGLSLDLPTEAQWEYACRAGTTSSYNNGGNTEADLKTLGRYSGNQNDGRGGYSEHTTVGSYAPNAWGLYDMHGNVIEWCLDWNGDLSNSTDPLGPVSGSSRRIRNGGWDDDGYHCTSSYRTCTNPSYSSFSRGFRLACSVGL